MAKALFGPSGNSLSFYEEGHKSSLETAKWVKDRGLDLFEYSFGQGYRMKEEMAVQIGEKFAEYGIQLSLHAPYFINFANPDPEMYEKSLGYIKNGIKYMKLLGAKRLIFHAGSCGKQTREDALALMKVRFAEFMPEIESLLDEDMYICPETIGKSMQIGTWKEIIDLCTISPKLLPTFDFGHVNAFTQGQLKTEGDYQEVFDYCRQKLGAWRTENAHVHFSKIEYGAKGEIRHLTFADEVYGPDFAPLAKVLAKNNLSCHIICESDGTMAEDSADMKNMYENAKA